MSIIKIIRPNLTQAQYDKKIKELLSIVESILGYKIKLVKSSKKIINRQNSE